MSDKPVTADDIRTLARGYERCRADLAAAEAREKTLREALEALVEVQPYLEVRAWAYEHWNAKREHAFDLAAGALAASEPVDG